MERDEKEERKEGGAGYKTRDERIFGRCTHKICRGAKTLRWCASMLALVCMCVGWVHRQQLDGCEN